ncbi:MAG: cyclase family protein [Steroidobacteraceae bacterium]
MNPAHRPHSRAAHARSLIAAIAAVYSLFGCARSAAPPAEPQSAAQSEAAIDKASLALTAAGPWPAGDQVGMANTLGAGTWMRCAQYLNAEGAKSYELSYETSNDMNQSPFGVKLEYRYRPTVGIPGTRHAFNGEEIVTGEPGAQATQLDALGHFGFLDEAWDGKGALPADKVRYYGGYTQADVKPTPGSPLLKLGVEHIPPIVTSAVLLDARAALGNGEILAPGRAITRADIDTMLQAQGLAERGLLPGDVLYIYTGWGENWTSPDYYTKGPGLAYDAAQYIAEKKIVLIALDNPFTDPVNDGQLAGKAGPAEGTPPGLPFAIHHTDLTQSGIHQIQNAKLDELARDKVWLSCTMILPLRSAGGAGSPVRPVAIGAAR